MNYINKWLKFAKSAGSLQSAAMLEDEYEQDMKKICVYSDGTVFSVSITSMCPLTI